MFYKYRFKFIYTRDIIYLSSNHKSVDGEQRSMFKLIYTVSLYTYQMTPILE